MQSKLSTQILLAALFALTGTAVAADAAPTAKRCLITDSGAVADGQTLNTKAIQSAIDRCATNGGGVVVVPRGTFLTGAIFLKQGVDLAIEKDGLLKGTTNRDDYPQVKTRWEGEEREWISALVNAFNMTGFKLTGEGMIDGSGDVWSGGGRRGGPGRGAGTNAPATGGARGARGDAAVAASGTNAAPRPFGGGGRPRLIAIQSCTNVLVSGLNFKNQASWCLFVVYSEKVVAENLTIRAEHYIPSSDGIDIDSCRNVLIRGCDIDVNDDCIAIKSGKDEDGRRVNRPAEDIIVEKCTFRYGHGGVSMGSETSGGIRNVEIRDCLMMADNWAPIRFKTQPSRGGVVENITYRDIVLQDTRKAFEFNMEWRMVNPRPPSDPLPVMRNVKIINVSGTTQLVGDMHGLKGSPGRNVSFENCKIKATRGFTIDNVEDIDLSGLSIEGVQGQAIIRRNAAQPPSVEP